MQKRTMQRNSKLIAAVAVLTLLLTSAVSAQSDAPYRVPLHTAPSNAASYKPGDVVVSFKRAQIDAAGSSQVLADHAAAQVHAQSVQHIDTPGSDFYVFHVAAGAEQQAVDTLRTNSDVEAADPNYVRYIHDLGSSKGVAGSGSSDKAQPDNTFPNDPYYNSNQWDMNIIRMTEAWDVVRGGTGVRVGIIDTGLDMSHPDITGNVAGSYGVINGSQVPADDDQGHGTHTAGTIGATTNNGVGVASVGWSVALLPCKAANSQGQLYSADWIACLNWEANSANAHVVNMSFGGPSSSSNEQNAITNAHAHNMILAVSAGNSAQQGNPIEYPCAYTYAFCVAATGNQNEPAVYSEHNAYVDIAAPGGNPTSQYDNDPNHWITSTIWRGYGIGDYALEAGTSMAAPHVAGLAALLSSCSGYGVGYPADALVGMIQSTALDLGAAGRDDYYGYGLINAAAAVRPYFTDVPCSYWAFGYIGWVKAQGIINGNNGYFLPNNATTRAEFCAMIVKAQGWPTNTSGGPHFSDVQPGSTFYNVIETAYNHGVVNGTGGGYFSPNRQVRRDEMAQFLVRARGWTIDTSGGPHFSDVQSNNVFYGAVETAYHHNAVGGIGGGLYGPAGSATRAQLSKVIYQSYSQ